MCKITKFFISICIFANLIIFSANANDQWRVVDKDFPEIGVPAEFYIKKGRMDEGKLVARSGDDGYASPTFNCDALQTLEILPGPNSGYFRFEDYCLNTAKTIQLQKIELLVNLVFNAKQKLDNKEYGDAALALREASERMKQQNFDEKFVISFSNSSVLSTATALNASGNIIADTQGIQLSEHMREKIVNFQISKNINTGEKTGQPTYSTIRALAKKTPWDLMSNSPKLDPNTLELFKSVNDKETLQNAIEKLSKSKNPTVFNAEHFSEFGIRQENH